MSIEKEMVRIACKALDDKKAKDIKVIDIHEVCVIRLFCDRKCFQPESGTGNG